MALSGYQPRLLCQPDGLVRINDAHWLARDLVWAHSGLQAFAYGRPQPAVAPAARKTALGGTDNPALSNASGWSPDGTNYEDHLLGFSGLDKPLTLSVWWAGVGNSVFDTILAVGVAAGGNGGLYLQRRNDETVAAGTMQTNGAAIAAISPNGFSASRWEHAAGVWISTTSRQAFSNGVGGTVETTSRTNPTSIDRVRICGSTASAPIAAKSGAVTDVALPMVIARALSADEIARLHAEQRSNPWGLFAERRIWVPSAGAGGGVTLTAAQGSYTLTGQAATLRVARNMAAAQGAYSLTGQAAGLRTSKVLTAAQGSYAITGQAATLTYSGAGAKTLTADAGTYSLTGQAAVLRVARVLTAAQGTYTYTGQDAALRRLYTLTAAHGAYALTGQSAVLRRALRMTAAQGSYALSGQAATLTYSGAAGSTISIVQPYIAVYFWRRTA